MRHKPVDKFTCPGCGERCIGGITWSEHRSESFYRGRKCERCGIKFVTAERVIGISRKSRRREE